MVGIIIKCCESLREALREFRNFRRSETLHSLIIQINRLEEEGDRVFAQAVRRLYAESSDARELAGWTRIFERLEKCCDACEDVSDSIESVVMKNS